MVGNKKNALLLESLRGENAVLTYLVNHREEIHPGTLAEHLSLVPGRTADILKSLEKKGLIIRRKDPEDRRKTIVSITEDGVLYIKERRKRIMGLAAKLNSGRSTVRDDVDTKDIAYISAADLAASKGLKYPITIIGFSIKFHQYTIF